MIQAEKEGLVEQLVAHAAVEALDVAILHRLAWGDVMPLDSHFPAPGEDCVRGQLGAVVADDYSGLAALGDQIGELAHDPTPRDRRVRHRTQALAGHIIDSGVKIVETAGGKQVREIWDMLKPHGVLILHKCTSVRHALSAERNGCDAISIDGFECAGHPGEDDVPGLVLIPAAADQVKIPLLASGGFGDGRGLIAALALGADAINMGTRFCATQEAPIHPAVKQTYLDHDERGTNLIFRQFHNTARVSKTEVSDEVVRIGSRPGATFEEVKHLVSGAQGAKLLRDGDLSLGVYWAGMVQGLIHDIPTVKELIDRIIAEAEGIVRERLAGMLG